MFHPALEYHLNIILLEKHKTKAAQKAEQGKDKRASHHQKKAGKLDALSKVHHKVYITSPLFSLLYILLAPLLPPLPFFSSLSSPSPSPSIFSLPPLFFSVAFSPSLSSRSRHSPFLSILKSVPYTVLFCLTVVQAAQTSQAEYFKAKSLSELPPRPTLVNSSSSLSFSHSSSPSHSGSATS